jgi:hypothetical protein
MCNNHPKYGFDKTDPFADLDDSDFETAPVRKTKTQNPHVESIGDTEVPGFVEDCPKCRGTGTFYSYTGRPVGPCHKCKGKGKLQFKTSPDARGKARASAQKRKARSQAENVEAFKAEFPAEAQWIISHSDGNTFADSLRQSVEKYGRLTEKQLAAVRKGMARDDDAAEGFKAWAAENEEIANWLTTEADNGNEFAQEAAVRRNLDNLHVGGESLGLDISSLKGYYAVPHGDTRLKLCVRKPGKNSRYHGWTFVDDGAAYGNRKTYGKQAPDGLYVGSVQGALKAILEDPKEAQIAYGKLTGVCGVCGRMLEDEESVAAGIGPVCASKM